MVGGVPDVITCAKFQIEIFMGYDFTGGRIFDFCIDFSMGLTTVQRYCAACDDNQFGFKKGVGCSHGIYTARNIVDRWVSMGYTANLCAIDLTKPLIKSIILLFISSL